MNGDPIFADSTDGMEPPMPDWFDDDFIQAVVDVAAKIPDRPLRESVRRAVMGTNVVPLDSHPRRRLAR